MPKGVDRLGGALWLYVDLALEANSSGHVCRTLATLAADLGVAERDVDTWLRKLTAANLVIVQVPSPYLVIKLLFWSREAPDAPVAAAENTRQSAFTLSSVPVSSGKLLPEQQPKAAPAAGVVGGLGEGEGLLETARRVLEPVNADQLAALLDRYPKAVVTKALGRVERTPEGQIRTSRLALFRFLLVKFSQESHAPTPPHQA